MKDYRSRMAMRVRLAVALVGLVAMEVAAGLAAAQQAVETGTVRGRVVDAVTGQIIPRARLRMTAYGMTAAADDAGVYVFTGVPVGATTLLASAAGYQDYAQNIQVFAGEQTIDVLMVPVGTQTTRAATLGTQTAEQMAKPEPARRSGPSTLTWILIGLGVLVVVAAVIVLL